MCVQCGSGAKHKEFIFRIHKKTSTSNISLQKIWTKTAQREYIIARDSQNSVIRERPIKIIMKYQ